MARFAAILLALSLAGGGALAASPEAAYLAARDKAIAEIKALEDSKASESAINGAQDNALADLKKQLKDIVGPVSVKGFPAPDRLSFDSLSEHQLGYGTLDGLVSNGEGNEELVITTRPLLTAWLEAKAKEEEKEFRLPGDVDAAVRQDNFYTFSVGQDAAFEKSADLPVTKPAGAALAFAALGIFTQAEGHWVPDAIVATVIKGNRVFVASVKLKAAVGKTFACEAIWTEAQRKHPEALEQVEKEYHACTNARARKARSLAGVTKGAQALLDRLAGE
jgi:hypothetical protein